MKKIIFLLLILSYVALPQAKSSVLTERQKDTIKTMIGYLNVKNYGAVGDSLTDDTNAFQRAIDSLGTYSYNNPTMFPATEDGGGVLFVPDGKYRITGTLYYPAGFTLVGGGLGSIIYFDNATNDNLFEGDTTKNTKGTRPAYTIEQVKFKDLFLVGSSYLTTGAAIDSRWTQRLQVENVTIYNFGTGIHLEGVGGGETYYHYIENCNILDNLMNLYIGDNATVVTITGCYIAHDRMWAGYPDYNIYIEAGAVTLIGNSIEGYCKIAQIYNGAETNTTIIGGYTETRTNVESEDVPFIKQVVDNELGYGGNTTINGLSRIKVVFDGFDLTQSDTSTITTTARYPMTFLVGNPVFIDDGFANANNKYGNYGWTERGEFTGNGTMAYNDSIGFRSYGSMELIHEDSTTNYGVQTIFEGDLSKYIGQRIYFTMLVKADSFMQIIIPPVAGNTQTKQAEVIADYGNGWKQYVVDTPILDDDLLYVYLTYNDPNDTVYVTNAQWWLNGWEYLPVSRDLSISTTSLPTTGAWSKGDFVENTTGILDTTGGTCSISFNNGTSTFGFVDYTSYAIGSHSLQFVADSTTTGLTIVTLAGGGRYSIDNISVKKNGSASELISNGTFADSTGWLFTDNAWVISNGKAIYNNQSSSAILWSSISFDKDTTYNLTFDISDILPLQEYYPVGWARITDGTSNTLGTDWVEIQSITDEVPNTTTSSFNTTFIYQAIDTLISLPDTTSITAGYVPKKQSDGSILWQPDISTSGSGTFNPDGITIDTTALGLARVIPSKVTKWDSVTVKLDIADTTNFRTFSDLKYAATASFAIAPALLDDSLAVKMNRSEMTGYSTTAHSHTDFYDTLSISWGVLDTTYTGSLSGWKVPNDITITEISAYTDANTVTFNLEERAETTPNTAGTDVIGSDLVADTDQQETSTFTNATIAKNSWLVPTISATGDVSIFTISVRYIKTN